MEKIDERSQRIFDKEKERVNKTEKPLVYERLHRGNWWLNPCPTCGSEYYRNYWGYRGIEQCCANCGACTYEPIMEEEKEYIKILQKKFFGDKDPMEIAKENLRNVMVFGAKKIE